MMKTIGTKLSENELLQIKGGNTYFVVCHCVHNQGVWQQMVEANSSQEFRDALNETASWACDTGEGPDVVCDWNEIQ